jgi:pantoate--beta-alanine ligase
MKVISKRRDLIALRKKLKAKRIGFVPTMGALHAGHISLVKRAVKDCDFVFASIFVNPTQFGPSEDFSKYPRPREQDLKLLKEAGCDAVFAPLSGKEVYPRLDETSLKARPSLSGILCGRFRPGHFDGVVTVVRKLFAWVNPTHAYFGEKDYQQVQVIKAMVEDLELPVKIVPCKTIREKNGLAMSSRNSYLSAEKKNAAARLYEVLSSASSPEKAQELLVRDGFDVQYLEVWNSTLTEKWAGPKGRWLVAAYFEGVRLIDNLKRSA